MIKLDKNYLLDEDLMFTILITRAWLLTEFFPNKLIYRLDRIDWIWFLIFNGIIWYINWRFLRLHIKNDSGMQIVVKYELRISITRSFEITISTKLEKYPFTLSIVSSSSFLNFSVIWSILSLISKITSNNMITVHSKMTSESFRIC